MRQEIDLSTSNPENVLHNKFKVSLNVLISIKNIVLGRRHISSVIICSTFACVTFINTRDVDGNYFLEKTDD